MRAPSSDLSLVAADLLGRVRDRRPRVHCITNAVAQTFTANMLLAAGAVPSMTISGREVAAFASGADALLVNLGTFDPERQTASLKAVAAVTKAKKPWVLDPVFVDRSAPRAAFARKLAAKRPTAIRLNQPEFVALAGGRKPKLSTYAASKRTVLALTGEIDVVHDAKRMAAIANGDPMMARVTAMGCAGSALLAAFLAVERDAWTAAVAALLALGVAGELAAVRARGPGSFAVEILDAIHGLDGRALSARAKVT
jgi:hydroxyethylthiazole kinase